jgi:hypothetical protein
MRLKGDRSRDRLRKSKRMGWLPTCRRYLPTHPRHAENEGSEGSLEGYFVPTRPTRSSGRKTARDGLGAVFKVVCEVTLENCDWFNRSTGLTIGSTKTLTAIKQ